MPGPRTLSAEIQFPAATVVLAAMPQPGEVIEWPPEWRALREQLDAVTAQLQVEFDEVERALAAVDEASVEVVGPEDRAFPGSWVDGWVVSVDLAAARRRGDARSLSAVGALLAWIARDARHVHVAALGAGRAWLDASEGAALLGAEAKALASGASGASGSRARAAKRGAKATRGRGR